MKLQRLQTKLQTITPKQPKPELNRWGSGRGGKKIANSFNKYDLAEDMGYKIQRFHPDSILSGHVINWIKEQLESLENGTDQTISTNRFD